MVERPYARKISPEEAAEGYILVEKDALKLFPPIGQPFDILDAGNRNTTTVEARDCTCRGPEKPHQHYLIRWRDLVRGQSVRITREVDGYTIEIRPPAN